MRGNTSRQVWRLPALRNAAAAGLRPLLLQREKVYMSSTGRNSDAKTIEVLRGLRQARRFTAEDVPQEAIDDILEVARWTGSGNNRQPWDLVLVRDHDTLKRIAEREASNAHIAGANFAIIVVNTPDNGIINAYDEGRLTERMMLAAEAHGVASG